MGKHRNNDDKVNTDVGREGKATAHRGKRGRRFFAHGDLRLVVLNLLSQRASHGYELIKAIETLTSGHYTPSPGVIYPTIDFLQQQNFIMLSDTPHGRKVITITDNGHFFLEQNRTLLQPILERINICTVGASLRRRPEMKRALDNIKSVLDLKVNRTNLDEARLKKIIEIIDNAAREIAQIA